VSRLVVIGAPGAGKSSVGSRVARRLGAEFIDTDRLVEERAGKSVSDIFVGEGEAAFRAMEFEAVADALSRPSAVVSLGGGSILDPRTRDLLADEDVVWLRVGVGEASRRVGLGTARPLLLGNVRGTLMKLLDERTPLYEEVATWTVDTDGRDIDAIVEDVIVGLNVAKGAVGADDATGGEDR